ncbi:hypothetical protein EDS67_22395 [candidate division KSB1 bacterium]|nr:MAG: hypothetical protein EDS67_22395 [candidate division KSB1 bacterium]MBC6951391.1 hypothetical protein [candidate division KSB1 bacterium]MCE7943732.1 hypothetical protein [Chlorobi bacterium CHB1]MDL1878764.1 hypothetical protein [Cytophagia bacterium CHB2]
MKDARKFTGEENHAITTAEALTFIKQFREHYGPEAAPGVFFDKQAVQAILDQPHAVGMRYYYGVDSFDQTQLVLVGTNTSRNDLLEGEPLKLSMMNPPLDDRGRYHRAAVSHGISLQEASELTARYQENLPPGQPKGGFFGKQAVQRLLDHPECVGLRCFFGANKDGVRVMVMLCVDKFGAEMFYGPMVELSTMCPPYCGWPNLLNRGISQTHKSMIDPTA